MKLLLKGCFMKLFAIVICLLFSGYSHAFVDMKNANYSHSWVDLKLDGTGFDLQLKRTYNSRSLHNGLFGFGWCSDYETKLQVTPEGNIKIIVCGGGNEIEYISAASGAAVKNTIKTIMRNLKSSKKFTQQNLMTIQKRLSSDVWEREKYARQFKIKKDVRAGVRYIAFGRDKESMVLKNNTFKRSLPDGSYQNFNIKGQMTYMFDKNNNYLKLTYSPSGQLNKVSDNNGRSISFVIDKKSKKVSQVKGPKGMLLTYNYKNEDLVYAKNAWKNVYRYKYDDLHNLIRVDYPDKTNKTISYNKNKDWVIGFKDRSNCKETYKYVLDQKDPMNKYYSEVIKKCEGKVTNQSRYEFVHKKNPDGSRYLARTKSTVNGKISEVRYHPKFGKAMSVRNNNSQVKFEYFKNGELKAKHEPARSLNFTYKNKCKKVSQVVTKYYRFDRKTASKTKQIKKLVKTVKTNFTYEAPKCNLQTAVNTTGQKVKLKYDRNGRIVSIVDQAKKVVNIKYDLKIGKPKLITRPGIGTIQVTYNPAGQINKVDSKEGPIVASQVAGIFSNLIEIISPATSELGI